MRRRSMHDGARYARPVPKARRFAMGCDGAACMMERAARAACLRGESLQPVGALTRRRTPPVGAHTRERSLHPWRRAPTRGRSTRGAALPPVRGRSTRGAALAPALALVGVQASSRCRQGHVSTYGGSCGSKFRQCPERFVSVSGTTFFRFRNEQHRVQAADLFSNTNSFHGPSRPLLGAGPNPGFRNLLPRVYVRVWSQCAALIIVWVMCDASDCRGLLS